jgi:hypothetical protein
MLKNAIEMVANGAYWQGLLSSIKDIRKKYVPQRTSPILSYLCAARAGCAGSLGSSAGRHAPALIRSDQPFYKLPRLRSNRGVRHVIRAFDGRSFFGHATSHKVPGSHQLCTDVMTMPEDVDRNDQFSRA